MTSRIASPWSVTRSTSPDAKGASTVVSTTWYLTELDPQLRTSAMPM